MSNADTRTHSRRYARNQRMGAWNKKIKAKAAVPPGKNIYG